MCRKTQYIRLDCGHEIKEMPRIYQGRMYCVKCETWEIYTIVTREQDP